MNKAKYLFLLIATLAFASCRPTARQTVTDAEQPTDSTEAVTSAVTLHLVIADKSLSQTDSVVQARIINPDLGRPFLPFAPIADEAGCQWVVANAPNKAFNIAGLQMSYIICPNADFRARIDRAININEVCDVNCFSFVALQAAYTPEGEEWLDQLNDYIYANYRLFRDAVQSAVPNLPIAPLEGTYLAWLDISGHLTSSLPTSEAYADYLKDQRKLWFNPGEMYGHAGFLRVNLATQRCNVEEALYRFLPLPKE